MSKVCFFLILFPLVVSSCSYEIIKELDTTGKTYRSRLYKDHERQEKYLDRKMFKYWYEESYYPKTNSLIYVCDSVVTSDSMRFHIRCNDSSFGGLFFNGVISGNVFDSISGNRYTFQLTNLETGEVTPPQKIYYSVVHSFKVLDFFKLPHNRMRIKFKALPYTYYIEIESSVTNSSATLKEFIDSSRLTFIHKCCAEI